MKTSLKFYLFKPGNIKRIYRDIKNGDLALTDLENYKTIAAARDLESYYKKTTPDEKPIKFKLSIELKKVN